jgi:hypothetical protein
VPGQVYSTDTVAKEESGRTGVGKPALTEEAATVISRIRLQQTSYST